MTILIKVPTQLRSLTDGAPETRVEGRTVAEVIAALEVRHPGFRERLIDDGGSLRRFVNVYVNEEDVRFQEGLQTSVPEGSEVAIIPAVAGG